jgi:Fe-S cluster assembly scaffold protein SufB
MSEKKTLAEEIADYLGETEAQPRRKIAHIVKECGDDFARDIMAQTLQVQTEGGMLITDESRQRTIGGVFFHLTRTQVDEAVRKKLFPTPLERKKQSKSRRQQQLRAALSAAMPPDVFETYYKLRALVSEYQRRIDTMAYRYESVDDLEAARQDLVDAQRQITEIEKQYEHIFRAIAQAKKPKS